MLANDYDDPSDNLVTPGISDFQQTGRRIELCAPWARIGEGDVKTSITGWVNDCPLLECLTYYINYQQRVSYQWVGRTNEVWYLRHSKMKIYEIKDLNKKKTPTRDGLTYLPSMDVAINILFVDIA